MWTCKNYEKANMNTLIGISWNPLFHTRGRPRPTVDVLMMMLMMLMKLEQYCTRNTIGKRNRDHLKFLSYINISKYWTPSKYFVNSTQHHGAIAQSWAHNQWRSAQTHESRYTPAPNKSLPTCDTIYVGLFSFRMDRIKNQDLIIFNFFQLLKDSADVSTMRELVPGPLTIVICDFWVFDFMCCVLMCYSCYKLLFNLACYK